MTDRKRALTDLLEKVEAGAFTPEPGGPTMPAYRRFVALAENALPQDVRALDVLAHDSYRGSLDAAKALHEAVLPGWRWEGYEGECWRLWEKGPPKDYVEGWHDDPARAWLIAILQALIDKETHQ